MKVLSSALLWRYAENKDHRSVSVKLRRRRFAILLNMIRDLPRPVRILDIGGRPEYWEMLGADLLRNDELRVTLLNLDAQSTSLANITSVKGDARSMSQFSDQQFKIVFSNSTIEHVGGLEDQQRMSQEVKRVGERYYVQTPNLYFPIEPHFIFPLFQFLPVNLRVWLVQHFNLGWCPRIPDRAGALREVQEIRLLTKAEVQSLFPDAKIFEEKFFGMTKSFVAYTAPRESRASS